MMTMDQILAAYKEGKITSEEVVKYAEKEKKSKSKYPLCEGQKGLWFMTKVAPSSSVYNVPMSFPFLQALDAHRFANACQFLAKKFPILTIKIEEQEGVPYQIHQDPTTVKPSFEDVSSLSGEGLKTLIQERAKQSFDMANGPLIKVSVFNKSLEEHFILIVVHHIVFDAASMPILLNELFAAYGAGADQHSDTGDSSLHNYFNFVTWQKSYLDSQEGRQARNYWCEHLKGELPLVELPMERKNSLDTAVVGATHIATISKQQTDEVRQLCNRCGVNLSVFFLVAYQLLLSRYTGNNDVLVGMPSMGRTKAEFDLMIGYFVNMMPIRASVNSDVVFEDFLKEIQGVLADGMDHASYPFPKLVSELDISRKSTASAVFQVVFSYQARNLLQVDSQNNQASQSALASVGEIQQEGEFKLVLEVREQQDDFTLKFKYDANILEASSVEQIANHYRTLISAFLAGENQPLGHYDILSDEEKHRILHQWTDTEVDLGPIDTLHGLFAEQCLKTPDNAAVIYQAERLTYQQLALQAKSLAKLLLARNIQSEELVAVIVPKSCEQIVAVYGVIISGGAFLPMDPSWPRSRHLEVLSAANCKTVLSVEDFSKQDDWPATVECINLKEIAAVDADELAKCQFPSVKGDDLAYVIYTSGSTGKPKGVMIQHGAATNTLKDLNKRFSVGANDRVLAISALSFDLAIYDIFGLLGVGGAVVLPNEEKRIDPHHWVDLVQSHHITLWNTVPSMLQMLVDHLEINKEHLLRFPLRYALLSGDWIPVTLPLKAKRFIPNMTVISLGGATEASIWSNFYPITDININLRSIPYGKPLWNQRFYILDENLNPCPIGVEGQLFIGGVGVAKGYFADQALTDGSFIHHEGLDQRLYKTGDLGRWMPDGNMELLGRIDHQIKLRGFRIELGEIESKLANFSKIHSCVVSLQGQSEADKRLVAYLVPVEADDVYSSDIIEQVSEYIESRLPDYMQPSGYMLLEKLPLTANGKVNRGALPVVEVEASNQVEYVEPSDEVEEAIVEKLALLLGIDADKISMEANFFALGGHSMLAMRYISMLQEEGILTDLRTIFRTDTLAQLAEEVEEDDEDDDEFFDTDVEEIPKDCQKIEPHMLPLMPWIENEDIEVIVKSTPGGVANIQDIYALAPRQEGILIHHLMAEGEDPYVLAALVSVSNEQVLSQYLAALQILVDRHDVLRTAVLTKGLPAPVQVVRRNVSLSVEDLTNLVDTENETLLEFMQHRLASSRRTMDLSKPPLLRVELVRGGKQGMSYVLLRWHHLIADHEGLAMIDAEVTAILKGQQHLLRPPAAGRDVIANAVYISDELNAEGYFTDMLGDITEPVYPFNLDNVRVESEQISVLRSELSTGMSLKLRRVAQQFRVSPAIIFHTAWALVVAKCSGRDDVVFGTVLSGRFHGVKQSEATLGMFINTLPLRVKLGSQSVLDVLLNTDRALIELMEYDQASLSVAQNCSDIDFGIPLFSALINYRHTSFGNGQGDGQPQDDIGLNVIGFQERTNYPFMVSIDDIGDDFSIELQIEHSVSAERVMGYIEQAIGGLINALQSEPSQAIVDISVLTESEKHTLLFDWNNTELSYDKSLCFPQWFAKTVSENPDRTALVFGDESLSYQQLNDRACQVAACLQAKGVARNSFVGLCVERSLEMVIGMLGIMKVGAAYVPLDPKHPQSRIEYVLKDADIQLLLTQSSLVEQFAYFQAFEPICLDDDLTQLASQTKLVEVDVTPCDLAYVIYTSGSTGNPKGVMIEYSSLSNLLFSMIDEPGLSKDDVLLAVTTFSFDMSVVEIFLPLVQGAVCHICDAQTVVDANKLQKLIKDSGTTVMQATPTTWSMLFYAGWRNQENIRVFCGGEALLEPLKLDFIRTNTPTWNLYGPTESTVYASGARLEQGLPTTIGKPVANAEFYVLDDKSRLLPIGVPGELCLGGASLARGYLNRDDLTEQKFVANPFVKGERMYRTGDLARWLENGEIDYLGRIDSQIKIRGFRVELGEVETHIAEHQMVQACVVDAKNDVSGEKNLVAYVVLEGDDIDPDVNYSAEFRNFLAKSLPDYFVPKAYVILDEIPLTPNGKIDRKALPDATETAFSAENYVAPSNDLEVAFADIWAEILGIDAEKISVTAGFFDLGGHSVLSMMLVNLANKRLHAQLDLKSIIENPSIKKLAELVSKNHHNAQQQGNIKPVDDSELVRLSYAQERLWFLAKLEGTSSHYNMPMALKFTGVTDKQALIEAIEATVKRHGVFRTRFVEMDDGVYQILDEHTNFKVVEKTVSDEHQLQVLFDEEAVKEFSFATEHLIRAKLVKQGKNEYTLLVNMHHIISDAMSLMVFYKELMDTYVALGTGKPLADIIATYAQSDEIQYRDYSAWQRVELTEEVIDQQVEYWKENLAGVNADLPLPTDRARPPEKTYNGAKTAFSYAPDMLAKLKKLSDEQGVTLYMTLLAAFAILLNRHSHQQDMAIGSPIANRNRSELENVIGLFVNTLVMRIKVEEGSNFIDVLQQVKEVALGAYSNQDIPFETLVDAINPERNLSLSPLFQVMFNVTSDVNDASANGNDGGELSIAVVEHEIKTVKFDLLFNIHDSANGVKAEVEYNTDLFDAATIERLVGHYTQLLDILGRAPNSVITGQDLMSHYEQQLVTVDWNETAQTFEQEHTLHGLFVTQVFATPDNIAVKDKHGQLSYQALYDKARTIAEQLQTQQVAKGELVGVVVEKGCLQVAAVMGVLLAGAAYLPVDVSWPTQRIEGVFAAGGCKTVLSTTTAVDDSAWCKDYKLIEVDTLEPLTQQQLADLSFPTVEPDELAYVIFTSGSTGKPKGVVIEHGMAANTVIDINTKFDVNADDSVLAVSLLSFDLSVYDIFGLLAVGGCVVYPDIGSNADPEAWIKTLCEHGVTVWNTVPGMLQILVDYIDPDDSEFNLEDIKLRLALLSGDWIPVSLPDAAKDKIKGLNIIGMGGATEASIWSNFYPIEQSMQGFRSVPYGKPLANQGFLILDDELNLCPIGVKGNLFITGKGVARGYWADQSLTDKQFMQHPTLKQRIYKTGDLGRWLNDGNIEFLGRDDGQVKVRGYRIELGEVQYQLLQQAQIHACVVITAKDKSGENRLLAYLVPELGDEQSFDSLDLAALRLSVQQSLSKALPLYMLPDAFVFLEHLPLSENGKVDRKALPEPAQGDAKVDTHVPPNTELEKSIAALWQEMLGIEQVGITDSFFEMGGNSILTVRFAKRLKKEQGFDISLRDVFRNPTIEMLTVVLESLAEQAAEQKERGESLPKAIRNYDVFIPEHTEQSLSSRYVVWRDGPGIPLFIANSVIAYSSGFSELAAALPEDVPVYGLQLSVAEFSQIQGKMSLEGLASFHVETIKRIQPQGPYRIIGHSSGGTLAYEIAYQLLGDDNKVQLLGMLDTHQVSKVDIQEQVLDNDPDELVMQGLSTLFQVSNIEADLEPENWADCYEPIMEAEDMEKGLLESFKLYRDAGLSPFIRDEEIWVYEKLYRSMYECTADYIMPSLPIPVYLFQADSSLEEQPNLGWDELRTEHWHKMTIADTDHGGILIAPSSTEIAEKISEVFAQDSDEQAIPATTYVQKIHHGRAKKPPVFCIPGAGGNVSQFIGLTDALIDDVSVYGIAHRGDDGGLPHTTIDAMATAYVEQITAVNTTASGPIQLIGHSLGSWIVFEIGCRLEALGFKVAPIIVLDPDPFSSANRGFNLPDYEAILDELLDIYQSSTNGKFSLSASDMVPLAYDAQVNMMRKALIDASVLPPDSTNEDVDSILTVFCAHTRMRYKPRAVFSNEVVILMSKESWCVNNNGVDMAEKLRASWGEYAKTVTISEVSGNHITMLSSPNIEQVINIMASKW